MVGGGQLARMTHQAAIALGQSLRVLATSPDESAALVAADVELGEHTDRAALLRLATGCDVVTFDHEHVPGPLLRELIAAGHTVHPGPDALRFAQDKAAMRQRLQQLGAPVPTFQICAAADVESAAIGFAGEHGWPVVVKTASGGYDGKGVWVLDGPAALAELAGELVGLPPADTAPDVPRQLVIEQLVPMQRELAAVLARSPFGQAAAWPVVETVQQQGICVQVVAPAPELDEDRALAATRLALRIAHELGVVGVLAVELFQVPVSEQYPDGIVVNELAMRPHNSGHWSMDGAVTGQFEQHLRAVLDYPLGSTAMTAPVTVMGNVLAGPGDGAAGNAGNAPGVPGVDERVHHLSARFPQLKIHLYGKEFRPGRKVGHVNVSGADTAELRRIAELAAAYLGTGVWPDGWSPEHPSSDGAGAGADAGAAGAGAGRADVAGSGATGAGAADAGGAGRAVGSVASDGPDASDAAGRAGGGPAGAGPAQRRAETERVQ